MTDSLNGLGPKGAELPSLFRESSLEKNRNATVRDRESLRTSCQEFEGILLGMIWKNMFDHARSLDGKDERPFGIMEDLAIEMAADSMSKAGGVGLWKMLYAQLAQALPEDPSSGQS